MKKVFALLMALTFLLTGCSSGNKAQDSASLTALNKQDKDASGVFNLSDYDSSVTYWATEYIDWDTGGYVLAINVDESANKATFEFHLVQAAPQSRTATAMMEISLDDLTGNQVDLSFDNDDWGHSGDVSFILTDSVIFFTVSNVKYNVTDSPEVWGFYDTSDSLVSNPNAFDDLFYTQDEYDALYGEEDTGDTSQKPTYDTSKSSGILASLGMTEQEFRDSCIPLAWCSTISETTVNYVDSDELLRYPNNYVGQHFVFCKNLYDYFICPYCNGTGYDERGNKCSSRYNTDTEKYDENGRHLIYKRDPDRLVPNSYNLYNLGLSGDGYPMYSLYSSEPHIYIFDVRDDIYSPNIAVNASVVPYLIFLGLTSDGTDLKFEMITCDASFY